MKNFRVNQNTAYERDVGIIKKYNDTNYRLIYMHSLRRKGFEEIKYKPNIKGCAGNTTKLLTSLSRTKSNVRALALCNEWEYFVTLTIDKEKCDRYNLDQYIKKMAKWINNYNCRKGAYIKYLFVPEPHEDGAWHLHGFIMGLPLEHLTAFNLSETLPYYLRDLLLAGRTIYNWSAYNQKFGFVTVEAILNHDKCANYITKYITKKVMSTKIELNHRCFYNSHDLKRAETIHKGKLLKNFQPDFENEYVATKDFSNAEEPLQYFE